MWSGSSGGRAGRSGGTGRPGLGAGSFFGFWGGGLGLSAGELTPGPRGGAASAAALNRAAAARASRDVREGNAMTFSTQKCPGKWISLVDVRNQGAGTVPVFYIL